MIFKGGKLSVYRKPVVLPQPQLIAHRSKRVAICFYGQTRPGSIYAIPNILRYIGDIRSECDIFIHTWNEQTLGTSYSKRIESGADPTDDTWHTATPVITNTFDMLFEAYEPRVMEVEEYSLQKTKNTWGGRRFDPVSNRWDVSMWRSIQESNRLKMKYALKNSLTYTHTVILRSDFVFEPGKSLLDDINQVTNENTLLFGDHMGVWPMYGLKRIEEVIWIAHTNVIDKVAFFSDYYSSTVTNMDNPSESGYKDWQFYAAEWIVHTLNFTFRPITNSVMRPYTQIDRDNSIDPLDPGFGNPPSRFGYMR